MNRRQFLVSSAIGALAAPALLRHAAAAGNDGFRVRYFPVPEASRSRDVTAASDGNSMWFCCQGNGKLGRLDPRDGSYKLIELGQGSAPHGVIVGPDKAAWVTDGGQNAIVRVDNDHKVTVFKLPIKDYANLNTAAFDKSGIYWFTGQSGYHGRLDPKSGDLQVWKSPGGAGSYGMTVTPKGDIWYASLAGNHIAKIDLKSGDARMVEPPTPGQGARRVWSDSRATSGSASGTAAMSRCTIPTTARGAPGACRASARAPTRSMSTTRTRSGSPTSAPMPSCASIR
jgi:virginiamycin B lyase